MERHRHAMINRENGRSPMREFPAAQRREFRRLLIERYGPYCQICLAYDRPEGLAVIDLEVPGKPRSWSIDHITPMSRGGRNEFANMWPAHVVCNELRGNKGLPRKERSNAR